MKELRIGLVLYGGVSLAVYMNGVVTEIWNALHPSVARDPDVMPAAGTAEVYRKLMDDLKRCDDLRIVVDTITGTSAGGVNGVVLGKAIATGANASVLNTTWIEKAGIEELAAPPPGRAPWWLRFGDHTLALLHCDFRKLRRRFAPAPPPHPRPAARRARGGPCAGSARARSRDWCREARFRPRPAAGSARAAGCSGSGKAFDSAGGIALRLPVALDLCRHLRRAADLWSVDGVDTEKDALAAA